MPFVYTLVLSCKNVFKDSVYTILPNRQGRENIMEKKKEVLFTNTERHELLYILKNRISELESDSEFLLSCRGINKKNVCN